MILADKIMCLRKQQGWSQEELANKLGVSRQSVSKWESEAAVPEMDKVVILSEIFDVSTDFLLKDDLKEECKEDKIQYVQVSQPPVRKEIESEHLNAEEVETYIEKHKKYSKLISIGTFLCIMCPVALILFSGAEGALWNPFNETTGIIFGFIVLFGLLGTAISLFIFADSIIADYEHLKSKLINLSDIDKREISEKRKLSLTKYAVGIAVGVVMIVCGALPLIIAGVADAHQDTLILLVGLLLFLVASGVFIIIHSNATKDVYEKLLNIGEVTPSKKEVERTTELLATIYWPFIVAIYLGWSLISMNWGITWVVWPVSALIFVGITGISRMIVENRERKNGL